jgi:hypothetical protein
MRERRTGVSDSLLAGLRLPEARKALAEVLVELFTSWQATPEEQAQLLGVADIAPYHLGEPLPDEPRVLERAGELLAIERALRRFFADQPQSRGEWMRLPNPLLADTPPLTLIRRDPEGAGKVRRLLEMGRVG